jgi:hypothetical protein
MSETVDIVARLRAANPVPRAPRVAGSPAVLAHITATARPASPRQRRNTLIRRPLLAAFLALLGLSGIALAANISVRYFESGAQAPPMTVTKALAFAAGHRHPTDQLALGDTVKAYVFTSATGDGAVYMAPFVHRRGFCAALAVPGKPVQADCTIDASPLAAVAGQFSQPWDLRLAPDVHALLGRLAPAAAGDAVRITFEDGTADDVPKHGRWFAYAVAGKRTEAGHRPVQLTVLRDGRIIKRRALEPVFFNTLASARALVPPSDGSRGQTVIRRYLLGNMHGRFADGGLIASHTDLASTRLVASLGFGEGIRLSVYAASVQPTPEWRSGGSILIGVTGLSQRPIVMFTSTTPARRATFELAGSCVCAIPRHTRSLYNLLTGGVPTGVSHVAVRTSDGREHAATIFGHGREWIWVGHARSSQRPVALIGRDASGAVMTRRALHGRGGYR